jgi:hypothetical protein
MRQAQSFQREDKIPWRLRPLSPGTGTDQVADPLGARFPSDPEAELPGRSPAPAKVPFRVPICTKLGTTQSN